MNEINKENTLPSPKNIKNENTEFKNCPDLFKDQIEVYEQRIQAVDINERLFAWYNYLSYLKQFTAEELNENKVRLQTVYSRCLDKCKAILKERPNDEYYTRIFVDYTITYDVRPLKMFDWGYKHRVGEFQSIFYIEWSNLLVKAEKFDSAIEILTNALEKKALPLEKLKEQLKNVKQTKLTFEHSKSDQANDCVKPESKPIKVVEENTKTNVVKKFGFHYDQLLGKTSEEEFSFEEVRARVYYKAHAESLKYQAKFKEESLKNQVKYIEEINELKSKLAQLETLHRENPLPETKEKISRLRKTRDSIMMNSVCDFRHTDSPDNLTNVTNMSTWVTNDTKYQEEVDTTIGQDMTTGYCIPEDTSNLTKLKMTMNVTNNLTDINRFSDKSSFMISEKSMDTLLAPSKKCDFTLGDETSNATLYKGGNVGNSMMTTCYPTPKTPGHAMSETHNLIENVFNQTDTIINNSCARDNNATESIFIYQDGAYAETMKFPKQVHPRDFSDQSKDFSIYKDDQKSSLNLENSTTKPSRKYNEDGSLFVYPNSSADNSLDSKEPKRKALKMLAEPMVSAEADIDFEMPMMASTCNFKQIKSQMKSSELEFDPAAASTCNFKNLKNQKESNVMEGRLLETILDHTDCEEDSDLEKEKLFANIRGALDSNPSPIQTTVNQNISKIIEEDLMTKRNFKGDSPDLKSFLLSDTGIKDNTVSKKPTSRDVTRANGLNFDWDDIDMTQKDENEVTGIDSKVFTFSPLPKDRTEIVKNFEFDDDDDDNNDDGDGDEKNTNKFLTQEKLDQTFNNDCYKLFFNTSTISTTQNFSQFNFKKIAEEQINEFNNEEANHSILAIKENTVNCLERTQLTMHTEKLKADNLMLALENTTCQQTTTTNTVTKSSMKSHLLETTTFDSDLNSSSMNSSSCGATTTNMNNTIFSAIRDPFDTEIKNRLLNRTASILVKKPNYKNLITQHPMVKEKHTILLMDGETYTILESIGSGAFAKIYLIQNKLNKKKANQKFALKVDSQATAWEFYITEAIHERLSEMIAKNTLHIDVTKSFIKMDQFMKYKNGCFSAMNCYENGSLLDLINYHVYKEEQFPYWFVLYLTLEMLHILDYLHKCKIIHADIKADNFLINKLPSSIDYFEPNKTKCLVLIDFNRSIDLNLLPEEAEFEAKAANKSLLCPEMKSNRTWTYQVDFYGMLSCIHCIIFKKYLKVVNVKDRNAINTSFPRNYDKIFTRMFDTLLNIPDCQSIPDVHKDWIPHFVNLFKMELGTSFAKFSKYLRELNQDTLRVSQKKK